MTDILDGIGITGATLCSTRSAMTAACPAYRDTLRAFGEEAP